MLRVLFTLLLLSPTLGYPNGIDFERLSTQTSAQDPAVSKDGKDTARPIESFQADWAEVEASPSFSKLSEADKINERSIYFSLFVTGPLEKAGIDPSKIEAKFLSGEPNMETLFEELGIGNADQVSLVYSFFLGVFLSLFGVFLLSKKTFSILSQQINPPSLTIAAFVLTIYFLPVGETTGCGAWLWNFLNDSGH